MRVLRLPPDLEVGAPAVKDGVAGLDQRAVGGERGRGRGVAWKSLAKGLKLLRKSRSGASEDLEEEDLQNACNLHQSIPSSRFQSP